MHPVNPPYHVMIKPRGPVCNQACDHFVDPEHCLGNIAHKPLADMVNSTTQVQFGYAKSEQVSPACRNCPVWFACHGGCPKNRDEKGLNRLCSAYQSFFGHIAPAMDQMAELIHQGRAPAEIMKA